MQPYQQRVVDENEQLQDKLSKLYAFFQTEQFRVLSPLQQHLLRMQARFMDGYAAVLEDRIDLFLNKRPEH